MLRKCRSFCLSNVLTLTKVCKGKVAWMSYTEMDLLLFMQINNLMHTVAQLGYSFTLEQD